MISRFLALCGSARGSSSHLAKGFQTIPADVTYSGCALSERFRSGRKLYQGSLRSLFAINFGSFGAMSFRLSSGMRRPLFRLRLVNFVPLVRSSSSKSVLQSVIHTPTRRLSPTRAHRLSRHRTLGELIARGILRIVVAEPMHVFTVVAKIEQGERLHRAQ